MIDALDNDPSVIEGARRQSGSHPYGILIVDDEEAILESLELTLSEDYRVFTATNGHEGLEILEREEIALVIVDQVMPSMSGVEFLEKVIECKPQTVRMMLTGYADIHSIVRAINDGRIYRYIQKPWEPDELRVDVKRALEAYGLSTQNVELAAALAEANERLRAENIYLRQEVERQYSFDQIIGTSPAMQRVFEVMEKVAQTDATVLLLGETGTGKDLVAHAIHYAGPRKDRRFVAQNCGALPDTLLESELFGHKRGAFTGAHADKKGLFEIADGGAIFLDEVGETEPGMQVRLLRVLQDGEIRPLGSSDTRKVDVRVIAASNRDLRKAVEEGRFREDLYYRLRVVEIPIPPLRERRNDIPALAHHFLDMANKKMGRAIRGFTNAVMDRFTSYDWSGNVRELENEIQRAVALAGENETVHSEMLSEHLRLGDDTASSSGIEIPQGPNLNKAVDSLKRAMIQEAMREAGSKTRAAERLGIPRQSQGGEGIFHVREDDRNLFSILEQSTDFGTRWTMAQRYVPAVREGDKRILLVEGEPLGAVLRVPAEDETRSNLHVGGQPAKAVIDAHDRRIIERIAPRLRQDGLFFVGIDVIGNLLTEVNVTSPTGIQEMGVLDGVRYEETFFDRVEALLPVGS